MSVRKTNHTKHQTQLSAKPVQNAARGRSSSATATKSRARTSANKEQPRTQTPMPRASRDAYGAREASADRSNTWWNQLGKTFQTPKNKSVLNTAGIVAAAPAVMLGAGGLSPAASPHGTDAEPDGRVGFDDSTPVAVADEVINGSNRRSATAPEDFPPSDTFAARTWNKIDRNRSGAITKDEIGKYLTSVGVKPGFLGLVHGQATSEAMKMLDSNNDAKITKSEVVKVIKKELKAEEFGPNGLLKPELVDKAFKEMDSNGSSVITGAEFEKAVAKSMKSNSMFKSTVTSIARKIGMDVLDTNRDGRLTRQEFDKAAADVAKIRASINHTE
jgi:Ca2+-binding EF-hand superfamily protein